MTKCFLEQIYFLPLPLILLKLLMLVDDLHLFTNILGLTILNIMLHRLGNICQIWTLSGTKQHPKLLDKMSSNFLIKEVFFQSLKVLTDSSMYNHPMQLVFGYYPFYFIPRDLY